MTATKSGVTAESVLLMHEDMLTHAVIVSGILDDKIAEVKAAQAAAKPQMDALAAAQAKTKADAEAALARIEDASAKAHKDLDDKRAAIAADLAAREAKLTEDQTRLASDKARIDAYVEQHNYGMARMKSNLDTVSQLLAKREKLVADGEAALRSKQAAFNARLEQLRVPS